MKDQNLSPQLNLLNQYEYDQTPVLAGINSIGHMIALKPIVENLGLDWAGHLRVIKNDPKTNQLWSMVPAIGTDGKTRDMVCMNQDNFNDWLWALNPKSENFKMDLWESYKKGLLIYILTMLKISLDELQKGQSINDSFKELRKLNEQKKEEERNLAQNQTEAKAMRSNISRIQKEIDEILNRNPNQLIIPLS